MRSADNSFRNIIVVHPQMIDANSSIANGIVTNQSATLAPVAPSIWWMRGAAIVLILFTLLNLMNAAAMEVTLRFSSEMMDIEIDDPGPYPENGSVVEQEEWNATVEAIQWLEATRALMEDERMDRLASIQLTSALIGIPITAVASVLLFAQDRRGLFACCVWILGGCIAQVLMLDLYNEMHREHFSSVVGGNAELIFTIHQFAAPIQIGFCNITLLALIAVVAMMTKSGDQVDPSGFHQSST